jgi:carboxyl-terminal processing protease
MYNARLPGITERDAINSKLQEIDSFVRNNYLREINDGDVARSIFEGYVSGLGDRHNAYLTAEQYRQQIAEESGQFVTAGIRAEANVQGFLEVTEVYTGSSAEVAGIVRGDIITEVNSRSVLEIGTNVALRRLDGEENTRVDVTTQRQGEVFNHSLIRQAIDVISVESGVINEIGFVRITTFNAHTASQFDAALRTFADANVRALLIDVRNNNAGIHHASVSGMVNSLIGAGTIARTEHRGGIVRDFIVTDDSRILSNIPIVILTNSGTSGSGELFAAILQSYANAQIVGTGTAGNAYLQQTHPISDGSAVRITVARIFLADGLDYGGTGLNPNFVREMDDEVAYSIPELRGRELHEIADVQIRRAFEIINTTVQS